MIKRPRYTIKLSLFAASLLLVCLNALQANDGVALLKIDHGARASGMGATSFSRNSDPNAVVYNPAMGAGFQKFTASFGHTEFWDNIRLESGFFAADLSSRLFIHGGIRFAAVDGIEGRTFPTLTPETVFEAHDVSFKGGLSYRVSPLFDVGIAAGWIEEKIDGFRGSAFNVDLGAVVHATPALDLAGSVTSFGSDFRLEQSGLLGSDDISLPTSYRLGGAYTYDRYLGAVEYVYQDDESHLHLGVDAVLTDEFGLRSGYMFNYDTKNFTAGLSFVHRNISVDYAFIPFSNSLGTSHLFNLTFSL